MLKVLGIRGWLVLTGVLILGAGASLGFLAASYLGVGVHPADQGESYRDFVNRDYPGPDSSILDVTNRKVYDVVGMSEAQRALADRILSEHFNKMKSLREEREALGRKVQQDIVALLDAPQKAIWEEALIQFKRNQQVERASQKVAMYKRELTLTPEQENAVYPIFLADQIAKDDLFRSFREKRACGKPATHEQFSADYGKLSEERQKKLQPILSSEQMAKFQELQKKSRPWFGGGPGGRQGPGRGPGPRSGGPPPPAPPSPSPSEKPLPAPPPEKGAP